MSHRTLRLVLSFLLLSSLLTLIVLYPVMAGDIPGQGEVAVVGKINVGDVIEVQRDGVPLREDAGTSYKEKRTLYKGDIWIVQGGPKSAEGLTWWYVSVPPPYIELSYTDYGWVAEVGKDGILNLKEKTNNNPPSKPTNQEPPNGATGVSLTPTLRASAFSDPDGDSHLRTWWEIRSVSDDSVVWDSGWRSYDLTSTTIPLPSPLKQNTQYKWRVRYMDSKGAWSPVSDFTQFTTGEVKVEQELQIVEHFKVTVPQGGSVTGTIKVYNPNDKDHKILANSFIITDPAGFKGKIYATNLGSDLIVPAKGYATIEIRVEADADCPLGVYYPKYKIRSDV
jgi:hypothetical protein